MGNNGFKRPEDSYILTKLYKQYALVIMMNDDRELLIQLKPFSTIWKVEYTFLQGNILYIGVCGYRRELYFYYW
jgi:hypothetical protein